LKINISSIEKNCRIINGRCTSKGITVVGVLKCVLGDTRIAGVLKKQGIEIFGDSRLDNLKKLRKHFGSAQELVLLRTPMISEIGQMLEVCSTSMNTQAATVKRISEICAGRNVKHNIIVMVETDDKREGLLPNEVLPFCEFVLKNCPNINILGLGTNARCISDRKPRPESISILTDLRSEIQSSLPVNIPVISGGNSSVWDIIENDTMPRGVNQVRMGEAILFGHETAGYVPIKGAFRDAFTLEAEVIEVKMKQSGIYKLIVALGLQDTDRKNIFCKNRHVKIIDQSSDHTVMSVNEETCGKNDTISELNFPYLKEDDNKDFNTGSILSFGLNYFGLLACMTSPFVKKIYIAA